MTKLLDLSRRVADEDATMATLSRMARGIDPDAHGRLLQRIDRLDNSYVRCMALEALVPALSDDLMRKAREVLGRIDNDFGRAEAALRGFYRRAPPTERQQWLEEAIAITAQMTDGERVGWIFEAWLSDIEGDVPPAMLEAARGLASKANDDGWAVACACLALLPRVDPETHPELFDEILSRVFSLEEADRPHVLGRLADQATRSELVRIRDLVAGIKDPMYRILGYAWTGGGLNFPFEAVEELRSRSDQDTAVGWLLPHIDTVDALVALEQDEEMSNSSVRNALKGLAQEISSPDRERVLHIARRKLDGDDLTTVLLTCAKAWGPHYRDLLRQALDVAVRASADVGTDTEMRDAVAACLAEDDNFVKQCWMETQRALGTLRRNVAMTKLYLLAPMITRVGGISAPNTPSSPWSG
ncbi:hypothetical protein [Sinorhizobium sp. BG8]|uniref:hypothetical protein n=1 Tax=Sinorhizobium sp. BG8 TaxID=2613773 RepID=UPI00193D8A27|nr:hypothetical protein [Sinorhizobium sp. BG8]QRM57249.1 hypothetical protein F3Y30_22335 [Sinorhizobium sp. BG8]